MVVSVAAQPPADPPGDSAAPAVPALTIQDMEALDWGALDDAVPSPGPTATTTDVSPDTTAPATRSGRPRSREAHRRILRAAIEILATEGYADLRVEHIAARAGVGKATIYRRWSSKEELAQELLEVLAAPHLSTPDTGDTRGELLAAVLTPMRALTDTPYGAVIRALLSQIARNPALGDPFRATVVQARREEVARTVARGVDRGDLRPDADATIATELLVGPVYFRLMFGGDLDETFAEHVVDAVYGAFRA